MDFFKSECGVSDTFISFEKASIHPLVPLSLTRNHWGSKVVMRNACWHVRFFWSVIILDIHLSMTSNCDQPAVFLYHADRFTMLGRQVLVKWMEKNVSWNSSRVLWMNEYGWWRIIYIFISMLSMIWPNYGIISLKILTILFVIINEIIIQIIFYTENKIIWNWK